MVISEVWRSALPAGQQVLALDVGGSALKSAIAASDGVLAARPAQPLLLSSHEEFVAAIGEVYDEVAAESDLAGVALSICGEVEPDTGLMLTGGSWEFNTGTYMRAALEARCGVPVSVENDANCALLAELDSGVLRGVGYGAVLVLGTGAGGSLLLDGQLYRGSRFRAGNFSFVTVESGTNQHRYLAEIGGVPALLRRDAEVSQRPVNPQSSLQLFARADAGDPPAIEALEWYCAGLAGFIHNLQLILDLEVVAIGGGVSAQPRLLHTLKEQVDRAFDTAALRVPPPRIEACTHRNDANLLGALVHHLQSVA